MEALEVNQGMEQPVKKKGSVDIEELLTIVLNQ
jgi:hypothetical protein